VTLLPPGKPFVAKAAIFGSGFDVRVPFSFRLPIVLVIEERKITFMGNNMIDNGGCCQVT
jgi:hypothetical protein